MVVALAGALVVVALAGAAFLVDGVAFLDSTARGASAVPPEAPPLPLVRPAFLEHTGQAPGPWPCSTFWATAICWALVACAALGAYAVPP